MNECQNLALLDWPIFRLNPERTGTSETQAISRVGQVKWQFGPGSGFRSPPAIVEDLLFIGCLDASLYAVDVSSGKERWRVATRAEITSSSAAAESLLVVGSGDGSLYAVNRITGKLVWSFPTQDEVHADRF
jgi:outer membrane protein assembly factor BamB